MFNRFCRTTLGNPSIINSCSSRRLTVPKPSCFADVVYSIPEDCHKRHCSLPVFSSIAYFGHEPANATSAQHHSDDFVHAFDAPLLIELNEDALTVHGRWDCRCTIQPTNTCTLLQEHCLRAEMIPRSTQGLKHLYQFGKILILRTSLIEGPWDSESQSDSRSSSGDHMSIVLSSNRALKLQCAEVSQWEALTQEHHKSGVRLSGATTTMRCVARARRVRPLHPLKISKSTTPSVDQ
jgi:hypothetical protein